MPALDFGGILMVMIDSDLLQTLKIKSTTIRKLILDMVFHAQSGHIGGSLGATDILVALYYHIMKHNPSDPQWEERDRFVLSKGHCTPVLYAILADCGYFPIEQLKTFRRPGSHLQGHPYQPKTPGVEASTGTLGLGLSTACGMALAAKLKDQKHHVYVMCGDGEIQEGQIWEAAMFANKYKLNNLTAIIDRNYLQTDGHSESIMPLDPLAPKWTSFGWLVQEIDGHNFAEIIRVLAEPNEIQNPTAIIANTTKGKGVPFMEDNYIWHGKPPSESEYLSAVASIS